MLGLCEEGIQQSEGIVGDLRTALQRSGTSNLSEVPRSDDERVNAAEEGEEFEVCQSHRFLGNIHTLDGEKYQVIHHRFEAALEIASRFNWPN